MMSLETLENHRSRQFIKGQTTTGPRVIGMSPQRRDKFSVAKRSQIMSKIRSKNTGLDLAMMRLLRTGRVRYRSYPKIFGTPDFLVYEKVAVFCDSSFWHGRHWEKLRSQLQRGSNASYWVRHIDGNRRRDRLVTRRLRKSGYRVARFWDSEILDRPQECLRKLRVIAGYSTK